MTKNANQMRKTLKGLLTGAVPAHLLERKLNGSKLEIFCDDGLTFSHNGEKMSKTAWEQSLKEAREYAATEPDALIIINKFSHTPFPDADHQPTHLI
jgi:hypothetical protein